jgi:hypothetical protein
VVPPPIARGRTIARRERRKILTRSGDDVGRPYGRGSRPTAFRSARALTDRPISASSAAAWAAIPRMSRPVVWSGWPGRGGVGGTPAGWAGWRRRSGRRGVARVAVAGAERCGVAGRAPRERAAGARLAVVDAEAPDRPAGEARLSLRRCGRRCGSAPSTSEGRSSLKPPHDGSTVSLIATEHQCVTIVGSAPPRG